MKVFRWDAASSLGRPANWSFMTRFNKAVLISQDSVLVRGAIGVLRKSLLLVLVKSHNLVLSWAIVTSKRTNTQANKKQAGKKRQIEKEREDRERGQIKRQGWSGGEENERQMENNVMQGIRVCDGYWVCLDLCVDSPATPPEILLATSWALPWFSLEEERVMQQSSVSISFSFWEPRYQSSRRPRTSPSHLHKQINSSQPTRWRGCQSLHAHLRKWDMIDMIR